MDSVEDIKKKLKELGVPVGEWGGVSSDASSIPDTQIEMLVKIRQHLQSQVEQDQEKLARLQEIRALAEHGGGTDG